ncbi:MAG: hypothetical protein ACE5QV_07655, partial [Fidelibacterota bacterium]
YLISYSDRIRSTGRITRYSLGGWRREGKREYFGELSWKRFRRMTGGKNRHTFRFRISAYNVFDRSYGSEFNWDNGKVNSLSFKYKFTTNAYKNKIDYRFRIKIAPGFRGSNNHSFGKIEAELKHSIRILKSGKLKLQLRAFSGYKIGGKLPRQEKYNMATPSPVEADRIFLLNEGGPLRSFSTGGVNRYHFYGGGNVRGYWNRVMTGDGVSSISAVLKIPLSAVLFFDGGILKNGYDNPVKEDISGRFIYDLGIGFRFSLFHIDFPLWLNSPENGEDNFKFRWVVRLGI